ncbi:MAG: hypothetical protein ABSF36_00035 [Candidatus Methanomethylicaceae archaeon]|jgi:hypothetical protein
MGTESIGIDQGAIYKKALLCRLEVQYTLALLRHQAKVEAKRTKSCRIDLERLPLLITEQLSKSAASLQDGDMDTLEELQAADSLIGRFISSLRNKKNKSKEKE